MIDVPYELPKEWEWAKLVSLSATVSVPMADGPFGSNLKSSHYTSDKEVRIIQLSNIGEDGQWKEANTKYTTFEHLKTIQRSEVKSGDLVIAKMMPAGKAIITPNSEKAYVLSSDAVKLVPNKSINSDLLLKFINSNTFREQVYVEVQGITRARTSLSKLKNYLVPIPPIEEQEKILVVLDKYYELISLVDNEQQSIQKLATQLKQKVLDVAMHGKLVPQDPNDEPASVLLEKIRAEKQRLFEEGKLKKKDLVETEIVKGDDNAYYENLPKNWLIQSISSVGDIRTGNTPSKSHSEYYNGEFPFFKPTDLSQGIDLRYSSETLTSLGFVKSRHLPKGSVLVNSIGNIGTVALLSIDGAFNQQINGIYPYSFVDSRFLFWLLGTTIVQEQMIEKASATTIAIINKTKFNSIQIAFPSILLQRTIADTIGKIVLVLNSLL